MSNIDRARINQISVKDLFGYLNYTISAKSKSDLIIIYGDNGSGKTTLLNIIFHLLASESSKGHFTYIANVAFRELLIIFADGNKLMVSRKTPSKGSYKIALYVEGKEVTSYVFNVDTDGSVKNPKELSYFNFMQKMQEHNPRVFFLSDVRKMQSNISDESASRKTPPRQMEMLLVQNKEEDNIDAYVNLAIKSAFNWIRRQALTASNQGETDTGKIYADIVKRIVKGKGKSKDADRLTFQDLIDMVESLKKRSLKFNIFGLAPQFEFDDLTPTMLKASSQKKGVINQVLTPYIRSYEARLNALEELKETLETFSGIFDRFYQHKQLQVTLDKGIHIVTDEKNSKPLQPEDLSSGEKQLLLLFCNVLVARTRPSVFIIDEPELSLNIKWQRELLSSLISCVRGCEVQFLVATHSLEMIALHKVNANKLINEV